MGQYKTPGMWHSVWDGLWRPGGAFFQIGFGCVMSHHYIEGLCTFLFKFWREYSKWSFCQQLSLINNRIAPASLGNGASEVGSMGWDRQVGVIGEPWYGGIHPAWPLEARRSLFPDWPWLCDESSPVTTQKGSAHSCSNFGGKIQIGVPSNS